MEFSNYFQTFRKLVVKCGFSTPQKTHREEEYVREMNGHRERSNAHGCHQVLRHIIGKRCLQLDVNNCFFGIGMDLCTRSIRNEWQKQHTRGISKLIYCLSETDDLIYIYIYTQTAANKHIETKPKPGLTECIFICTHFCVYVIECDICSCTIFSNISHWNYASARL